MNDIYDFMMGGQKVDRQNFVFLSFLLKDLHKNVYVTDRKVELLGCMYDDGVVVVVAHSV